MAFWNKSIIKALAQFGIGFFDVNNLGLKFMANAPCHAGVSNHIQNSALDAYSYLAYNCDIYNTCIGKYCSLAQNIYSGLFTCDLNKTTNAQVFQNTLDFSFASFTQESMMMPKTQPPQRAVVEIGNDVWIGANAVIAQGIKIGTGAVIGAGAVITKDVPPYAVMVGFDRHLKNRFKDEVITDLLESAWWEYDIPAMSQKVDFPFTEPQCLAQFIKDLDPSQLIPIADKWLSFDMPQNNQLLSTFNGKKITHTEVQRFFAELKQGQVEA